MFFVFTCMLGRYVAYSLYHVSSVVPTRFAGRSRDRVSGHLRGDKECPISGKTNSGIVWRKVPESDDGNVLTFLSGFSLR